MLAHLVDVSCTEFEEEPDEDGDVMEGFKLTFAFAPNPFFEHDALVCTALPTAMSCDRSHAWRLHAARECSCMTTRTQQFPFQRIPPAHYAYIVPVFRSVGCMRYSLCEWHIACLCQFWGTSQLGD